MLIRLIGGCLLQACLPYKSNYKELTFESIAEKKVGVSQILTFQHHLHCWASYHFSHQQS